MPAYAQFEDGNPFGQLKGVLQNFEKELKKNTAPTTAENPPPPPQVVLPKKPSNSPKLDEVEQADKKKEDERRRLAEEKQRIEKARKIEEKRAVEEKRVANEKQQQAQEEARRAEEECLKLEEERRVETERQAASDRAEKKRIADAEAKEEERLKLERTRRAEEKRIAAIARAEKKRIASDKRRQETQRLIDEAQNETLPEWCPSGVSEDSAYREAIQRFNNKDYQRACNDLIDLHNYNDVRADYWLGKDIVFFRSFCAALTVNLKVYKDIRASIMDANGLTEPLQGFDSHYLYGATGAKMIERAARCGVADAQADMGRLYLNHQIDRFVLPNEKVAEIWLKKSAANKSKYGTYLLGLMAQNELIDGNQWDYYIKAADLGHLYSMQRVAENMYVGNKNLPQNRDVALIYLQILKNQKIDIKKRIWAKEFIQRFYKERVERR